MPDHKRQRQAGGALEPEVIEGGKVCPLLMGAGLIGAAIVVAQGLEPNFDATCLGQECQWWLECSKR